MVYIQCNEKICQNQFAFVSQVKHYNATSLSQDYVSFLCHDIFWGNIITLLSIRMLPSSNILMIWRSNPLNGKLKTFSVLQYKRVQEIMSNSGIHQFSKHIKRHLSRYLSFKVKDKLLLLELPIRMKEETYLVTLFEFQKQKMEWFSIMLPVSAVKRPWKRSVTHLGFGKSGPVT